MFRVSPILPTQKSLWCYRGLRITSYSGMILIRYEDCGSSESTEVAFELPEVQPRFAFQQNFGLSGVTYTAIRVIVMSKRLYLISASSFTKIFAYERLPLWLKLPLIMSKTNAAFPNSSKILMNTEFKIACFLDHDFSLEFPSRQKSKSAYSTVKINGDKDIDALTICLWMKPSLGSDLGLLRYFDEAGSDVYFALRLGSVGQIWLSIHGEDR